MISPLLGFFQKQLPKVFCKKGVHKKFRKIYEETPVPEFFFNKFATLLKKRLWYRCIPVSPAKILRTPYLQNISQGLLLVFQFFRQIDIRIHTLKNRTPSVLKFRWTNKSINNRKSNSNIYLCYENRVILILKTPLTLVNWAFQGTP